MKDYHNIYLETDVLLLANVFKNFRKTCLKYYKLDHLWYYTSPGLSWDACLKRRLTTTTFIYTTFFCAPLSTAEFLSVF